MYAIAFDLDVKVLEEKHETHQSIAYGKIERFLRKRGFSRQQGSVYFGDPEKVNSVTCSLAVVELSREFPWFSPSVRDIRMLRIEENNDLKPAVNVGVDLTSTIKSSYEKRH